MRNCPFNYTAWHPRGSAIVYTSPDELTAALVMGMLQIQMKKTPEGKTPSEFCAEVQRRVNELVCRGDDDGDRPEGGGAFILKPEDFETRWSEQENLKQTPEIKEKYRQLTAEGKVICVEIDW